MKIFKSRDELTIGQRMRELVLAVFVIILLMAWALVVGGGWYESASLGYAWSFLVMGYLLGAIVTSGAAQAYVDDQTKKRRDEQQRPAREAGLGKLTDEEKKALGLE